VRAAMRSLPSARLASWALKPGLVNEPTCGRDGDGEGGYEMFQFRVVGPMRPLTQSRVMPSGQIHPMTYSIKKFAKTSLAFSLEANTWFPPAESCSGSAIEASETILGPEERGIGLLYTIPRTIEVEEVGVGVGVGVGSTVSQSCMNTAEVPFSMSGCVNSSGSCSVIGVGVGVGSTISRECLGSIPFSLSDCVNSSRGCVSSSGWVSVFSVS